MGATQPILIVSFENLRRYLREQEIPYWELLDENSGYATENIHHVTVDDLIDGMRLLADDEYAYVFPYDDTYAVAQGTDFSRPVPELVDYRDLDKYRNRGGRKEFLWLALSIEQASNGAYWTLMMQDEEN